VDVLLYGRMTPSLQRMPILMSVLHDGGTLSVSIDMFFILETRPEFSTELSAYSTSLSEWIVVVLDLRYAAIGRVR
jgi:hypothetical protein